MARTQWCREHIDKTAKECSLGDDIVSEVQKVAEFCAEKPAFADCATRPIFILISKKDALVKDRAISLAENTLNDKTPTGGKKKNQLTEKEIKAILKKAEMEVRGEITQKTKDSRKPAEPAPVETPALHPANSSIKPDSSPAPAVPAAQPSLAAQMSGAVPPAPAAHNPPPCKGSGGCQKGKFSVDKVRGGVCAAVGQPINQIDTCPFDTRKPDFVPQVDSGFRSAGSGKSDMIRLPPRDPRLPTDPGEICRALVVSVLDKDAAAFVQQVAVKEYAGDLIQAVKGIVGRAMG